MIIIRVSFRITVFYASGMIESIVISVHSINHLNIVDVIFFSGNMGEKFEIND